jgi:hypothetical protein
MIVIPSLGGDARPARSPRHDVKKTASGLLGRGGEEAALIIRRRGWWWGGDAHRDARCLP